MGEARAGCNSGATWCCVRSVPHKENWERATSMAYRERAFCFLHCCTRPCTERPFCCLLVSPARLYKSLACLYSIDWKSVMPKPSALLWLHATSKWTVFRSVESHLRRRLIKFPFLLVPLGWVAQELCFSFMKMLKERAILTVAQLIFIREKRKDEGSFSGTSIWEAVRCFSEMLLWQVQTLLGAANKEQKPHSEEGLQLGHPDQHAERDYPAQCNEDTFTYIS